MYRITKTKFKNNKPQSKTSQEIYSDNQLFAELNCLEQGYAISKDLENGKIVAAQNKDNMFECDIYSKNELIYMITLEPYTMTVFDVLKKETNNFHKDVCVEIQDSSGRLIRFMKFIPKEKKFLNDVLMKMPVVSYERKNGIIITI